VDRIIGITDNDIKLTLTNPPCLAGAVRGYSNHAVNFVVLSHYSDPNISQHELGHTYNFCDEYFLASWRAQNAFFPGGCPNPYPAECGADASGNPAPRVYSFGCGTGGFCACNSNGDCNYWGNGGNESYLNCFATAGGDCAHSALASCGNSHCDAGENVGECPEDCGPAAECPGKCLSAPVATSDCLAVGPYAYGTMGPAGLAFERAYTDIEKGVVDSTIGCSTP
jgi:hypothetical protein